MFKIAIVNPLTLVGTEIRTILRERGFPASRISLLDSTGKDAGALTENVDDEPAIVAVASREELSGADLVFFCGPPAGNRELLDGDYVSIDLSQPTTSEDGRLVIAGMNLDDVDGSERTIISPHPIATPIALLLHELEKVAQVELCTATVIQPASAFEQAGVEELAHQTISVLNVQSVKKEIFDRQLAFNLYPATERHEEFIVSQIRAVTDVRAQIAMLVTQGTIFHGHTFSLFVKTREAADVAAIERGMRANPALAFAEGDQEFGTIDAAGRDEVLVAEVRADAAIEGGFWIWAVCDNLRRSSALNAVLIAEKVLSAKAN